MDDFFLISDGVVVWVNYFNLVSDGRESESERERERERERLS